MSDQTSDDKNQEVSNPSQQRASKRESTRSQIALFYVCGYLVIVAAAICVCAWMKFPVQDYKDLLLGVSGILSGPLGFIIGYYFKASGSE